MTWNRALRSTSAVKIPTLRPLRGQYVHGHIDRSTVDRISQHVGMIRGQQDAKLTFAWTTCGLFVVIRMSIILPSESGSPTKWVVIVVGGGGLRYSCAGCQVNGETPLRVPR